MPARVVASGPEGLGAATEALHRGGVVGIPTDTVYGIAVALDTPGGVERLFTIKERPSEKAVMVLVDDPEQVAGYVEPTAAARALSPLWPGGLTLVLPLRRGATLPGALTAGTETLGIRVPDHPVPRAIARVVGPLPTTSANPSGAPEARSANAVLATLGDRIELILDDGPSPGGVPSTIVDCSGPRARLLRPGAVPIDLVAAALDAAGVAHDLRP